VVTANFSVHSTALKSLVDLRENVGSHSHLKFELLSIIMRVSFGLTVTPNLSLAGR
jgi:hypothetical protein